MPQTPAARLIDVDGRDLAMDAPTSDAAHNPGTRVRLEIGDPRTVVWLWGDHDCSTLAELASALDAAVAGSDGDVVVDLGDVTFVDASTIGALVRGRAVLSRAGRALTVRSPTRPARLVLEVCDLTELVEPADPRRPAPSDAPRG